MLVSSSSMFATTFGEIEMVVVEDQDKASEGNEVNCVLKTLLRLGHTEHAQQSVVGRQALGTPFFLVLFCAA